MSKTVYIVRSAQIVARLDKLGMAMQAFATSLEVDAPSERGMAR